MYEHSEKDFNINFRNYLVEKFKRLFLTVVFFYLQKTEAEMKKFHGLLNALHRSIRVTMEEIGRTRLPFLDS